MIPYESGIVLQIASPGTSEGEECEGLFGRIHSRAGAKLKYVTNDIDAYGADTPTYGGYLESEPILLRLIDPTVSDVKDSVRRALEQIAQRKGTPARKNVFSLVYAGHGRSPDGALVLSDGALTAGDLYRELVAHYQNAPNELHVDLVLDSCFSAGFLIDFVVNSQLDKTVYAFDCKVSSLPDEPSFEMDYLEHGALSFTLAHPGNSHVDPVDLARAIDNRDWGAIVKSLQGVAIPNPVALLTNARQHSMELIAGVCLSIDGAGSIDLAAHLGTLTHTGLADAIDRAKSDYGGRTEYIS